VSATLTVAEQVTRAESRLKLALKKLGNERHEPDCTCDPCLEISEREVQLHDARQAAEREQRRQVDRSRLFAEANRERIDEAHAQAQARGERAVQALLQSDTPEVTVKYGPIRVTIRYASSDPQTLAIAAQAVRICANLVQLGFRDRLQGVRAAAMSGTKLLPMDVENIKRVFDGALDYQVKKGLVTISTVGPKKRR
jgi:hypothetical protein